MSPKEAYPMRKLANVAGISPALLHQVSTVAAATGNHEIAAGCAVSIAKQYMKLAVLLEGTYEQRS